MSSPPRLEDFVALHLPEEDVRDLQSCRIGDCQLKLGEKGPQAFRSEVNWNAPGPQAAAEAVMRRLYLLEYPKAELPNATSLLYWQETEFGLKPTIRVSHLTIREGPDDTVVASKMLYDACEARQ